MQKAVLVLAGFLAAAASASAYAADALKGPAAYGDWHGDAPGVRRLITPQDLPAPYASRPSANNSKIVARPSGALPKVPAGFAVELFAEGLENPRTIRVAPNGDIFLTETRPGRIRVLRAADGAAKPALNAVFADDLHAPFGIAFYPAGPDPQFVYIANTDSVIRYPYRNGDTKARGPAETIVAALPTGGHSTRDIAFSPDGSRLFVSVGSRSNVAEDIGKKSPDEIRAFEAAHGTGAAWGSEENRAVVLATAPDGKGGLKPFATGIRNCVGMVVQPGTGDIWCATNERDALGDNLPPDYVSRIGEGKFYGWPWYYIGPNEDPRHKGDRPDLAGKVTVPDVLIQSHSAPLQLTFYTGTQFPAEYRGSAFVALHGSWNRAVRTGYKVVRIVMKDGKPTGEYEDFMTGMVSDDAGVWARPVGVAVAHDGSLLVTEDGNGTIWRVTYSGR